MSLLLYQDRKTSLRWRLALVMSLVTILHVAGVLWWTHAQAVSGQGAWSGAHQAPFRVRATVLQESVEPPSSEIGTRQHLQTVEEPEGPSSEHEAGVLQDGSPAPGSLATNARADLEWSPILSHYLSDEQVDAFPRPKVEWELDLSQVPLASEGWLVTVRLWVSASGLVDHVETMDAQPTDAWVVKLLAPLARTEMEPATLAGQPVPVTFVVQLAPDQLQ